MDEIADRPAEVTLSEPELLAKGFREYRRYHLTLAGADGAAAYLQVNLGAHIASAGFVAMSGNQPENARFREYQSSGAGANATAHASYQMTATEAANYTVQTVLGGWVPSYSQ